MSPYSPSPRPAAELVADGYVRVSRVAQADGHSPEVQREAITALIAAKGWRPGIIEEDHESGGKVTRKGYQKIVRRVQDRASHVVVVYMFDRWGRDGPEWLTRAEEFDRLGAELVSVQEGRDDGGIVRYVRIGMAVEEARKIARRARVPREISARAGIHSGPTPFGYRRVYPEWDGKGKRPPGLLVPHEPEDEPLHRREAWIVRELFTRYATGTWSLRRLAEWLNGLLDQGGPRPPSTKHQHRPDTSRPACERWGADTLRSMLKNPVYAGLVRYNHRPNGRYETAGPGSEFTVGGKHEPLVSRALFDEVQRRLELAHSRSYNTLAPERRFLLTGLVRCPNCGGPMMPIHRDREKGSRGHGSGELACRNYRTGASRCPGTGLRLDVAEEALLAQVRRLRGAPWTPEHDQVLTGDMTGRVAQLSRALEEARETLRRHTRRMSQAVKEPSPAELRAFQEVSAELAGQVEALEKQLSAVQAKAEHLPRWRRLHAELTRTEVPRLVERLRAAGKDVSLRDLVESLVASAVVVERWPERHSTWARMEVMWTDDVQTLLDAEVLTLDSPPACPVLVPSIAQRRARQRRYYAARRDREVARSAGNSAVPA